MLHLPGAGERVSRSSLERPAIAASVRGVVVMIRNGSFSPTKEA
jgi:hypothetical protein